jgi:hypothetical protein
MNTGINRLNQAAEPQAERQVTFWQTVGSVLASFYGVQSSKNRARDFSRGNALVFIGVGVGLTALFGLILLAIVKLVLFNAGV